MPPEYVDTFRERRIGEVEACEQIVRHLAGVLHVPQPGHQHQVLPAGEDLVDRGELSGQTDGFPNLERVRRDVESIDGGGPGV